MTVGRALSDLCGFPLYHNHLSIEAVVPVFGFGHPSMGKIVDSYRQIMFDEVLASDHRGMGGNGVDCLE